MSKRPAAPGDSGPDSISYPDSAEPTTKLTRDAIFLKIVSILHQTFDIDATKIVLDARLYDDLDIDSIDAIDLIVQLKPLIGKRLQPEAFKSVRTVSDVVEALYALVHERPSP